MKKIKKNLKKTHPEASESDISFYLLSLKGYIKMDARKVQ